MGLVYQRAIGKKQSGFCTERRIVGTCCESSLIDIVNMIVYEKSIYYLDGLLLLFCFIELHQCYPHPCVKFPLLVIVRHGEIMIVSPLPNLCGIPTLFFGKGDVRLSSFDQLGFSS